MTKMSQQPLPENAKQALFKGNKIEAIKIVREAFGSDLKDSKDFVEQKLKEDSALNEAFLQNTTSQNDLVKVIAALIALAALWVLYAGK